MASIYSGEYYVSKCDYLHKVEEENSYDWVRRPTESIVGNVIIADVGFE